MDKEYMSNPDLVYFRKNSIEIIVNILPCYKQTLSKSIKFIFDTGCDVTSITEDTLNQLGYTPEWCREHGDLIEVDTAANRKPCKVYKLVLPTVTLLGNVFHNVEVTTNQGCYNLLGMNILGCYDWILSLHKKDVKYKFVGKDGDGHQIKSLTGESKDFSAYGIKPLAFNNNCSV